MHHRIAAARPTPRPRISLLSSRVADLVVLPLVLLLSALPLQWFAANWKLNHDGSLYLLTGWDLLSRGGYTFFERGAPMAVRGPGLPAFLALLMLPFGRDVHTLAWALRLAALANPLLMYFLIKRLAGPAAGLLAAALVAFLGYSATLELAVNVDAFMLSVYLLSVLTLLIAIQKDSAPLSALSGALLGWSILTKETSIVGLPVALVAALLLPGWRVRGVVLHYAGVLLVCLPWWVEVWAATGKVYLVGRLPGALLVAAAVAGVLLALLGLALSRSRSRELRRLLGNERRRLWAACAILLGWTALLSILLVSTRDQYLPRFQGVTFWEYFHGQILLETPLWFLLPLACLYVLWKAYRGARLWAFYLSLLVVQAPVMVLVLLVRWISRQFLLPQTLLYGALAALTVELVSSVLASGEVRRSAERAGRVLAVGLLAAALLYASAGQVEALLKPPEQPPMGDPENDLNAAVADMSAWIARHVPPGEGIVSTQLYLRQITFQDGRSHHWSPVKLQELDRADIVGAAECGPKGSSGRKCVLPRQMVWLEMEPGCNAQARSTRGLLKQLRDEQAEYLLVTGKPNYPGAGSLLWLPHLKRSGAFKVAHSEYLRRGASVDEAAGLVLLRRTGDTPKPAPTTMTAGAWSDLVGCLRQARGDAYAATVRAIFPYRVNIPGRSPEAAAARREVAEIYR